MTCISNNIEHHKIFYTSIIISFLASVFSTFSNFLHVRRTCVLFPSLKWKSENDGPSNVDTAEAKKWLDIALARFFSPNFTPGRTCEASRLRFNAPPGVMARPSFSVPAPNQPVHRSLCHARTRGGRAGWAGENCRNGREREGRGGVSFFLQM